MNSMLRGAAALLLAAGLAGAALADVTKGNEALEKGDTKTALREFNAAANRGDAEAMFTLSRMYAEGKGVNADRKVAFQWMEKAAQAGYVRAQGTLAMFFAEGVGTSRDDAKSLEWARRAADGGDVISQFIMGVRYSTGTGVPRDAGEAASWWGKAAGRGFVRAQVALADQLILRAASSAAKPEDASSDRVEALKWLIVAGGERLPGVEKVIGDLRQKMTPEEISSAEDKARDWRPSGG
jgi:TPR repeat protein